jgi:hypothetical protein
MPINGKLEKKSRRYQRIKLLSTTFYELMYPPPTEAVFGLDIIINKPPKRKKFVELERIIWK